MDMIPTEIVFMCYGSHKCRRGYPYVPRFSVASVRSGSAYFINDTIVFNVIRGQTVHSDFSLRNCYN